jgi:hypothetical protein
MFAGDYLSQNLFGGKGGAGDQDWAFIQLWMNF